MPTAASAITAVASHPSAAARREIRNFPMIFGLLAMCTTTAISGTANLLALTGTGTVNLGSHTLNLTAGAGAFLAIAERALPVPR